MGEIRIVSPGRTHGYPYLVCKKIVGHITFQLLLSKTIHTNISK